MNHRKELFLRHGIWPESAQTVFETTKLDGTNLTVGEWRIARFKWWHASQASKNIKMGISNPIITLKTLL